jgi:hypothetical protein
LSEGTTIEDAGDRIAGFLQHWPQSADRRINAIGADAISGPARARGQGKWAVDDTDDIPNRDPRRGVRQPAASIATAATVDNPMVAQLYENSFQKLLWYFL